MCNPATARSIVALLLDDPGVVELWKVKREADRAIADAVCPGCQCTFTPVAFGRQYCSRACYEAWLERRRGGRPPTPPRKRRQSVNLGSGRRVPADVRTFLLAKRGQGCGGLREIDAVIEDVQARFGVRIGVTTVYRVWRVASGGRK